MSEYVKKTPFGGYKEVQGGYSSSEWEYVILTRKEYNNQETELRVAKAGKSEAEEKARKNIDRANVEALAAAQKAYNDLYYYDLEVINTLEAAANPYENHSKNRLQMQPVFNYVNL